MIRLFLPGMKVPSWLEEVEVIDGKFLLRFTSISIVWSRNQQYKIRPILPASAIITGYGTAETVNINGQSPSDSGKPVIINCKAFIDSLSIFGLGVISGAVICNYLL